MAHKILELDGVQMIAQEVMRVGEGVRCRIAPMDAPDAEYFDWVDYKVFEAAPDYRAVSNPDTPSLQTQPILKYPIQLKPLPIPESRQDEANALMADALKSMVRAEANTGKNEPLTVAPKTDEGKSLKDVLANDHD